MKKKLLYLDIDGILLGKKNPSNVEIVLANHTEEFLRYCLQHYKCFWLTTHCKNGDQRSVINLFKKYADDSVMSLVKAVKPTRWDTLKTEAVDLASDFYLIDDSLLQFEEELLRKNNRYDRWIRVDTRADPDDLKRAIGLLKKT